MVIGFALIAGGIGWRVNAHIREERAIDDVGGAMAQMGRGALFDREAVRKQLHELDEMKGPPETNSIACIWFGATIILISFFTGRMRVSSAASPDTASGDQPEMIDPR